MLELLADPDRCQVVLVTLPEETPVNELVETAFALEDEVGVQLGPVVVNGRRPGPDRRWRPDPWTRPGRRRRRRCRAARAAAFRRARQAMQAEQVARGSAERCRCPRSSCPCSRWPVAETSAPADAGRPAGARRMTAGEELGPLSPALAPRSSAERDDRRVLRVGRRRQDDHGGRASALEAARPRAPRRRRHDRPGPAARRRASGCRDGLADRRPQRHRRGPDGRGELWAMMLDTKGDLRRPGRSATRADPAQAERILANRFYRNISGALSRHAGVHGGREALRAPRRRPLRPRRRRHAADPQRPRLPRGAGAARPASSTTACTGP